MNCKDSNNMRDDFRSLRAKLPPEAFALGPEGPDSPPSDLVDQDTWHSIVSLPDDVSVRTSDHYGSTLKALWSLWGEWSCLVGALQETVHDPTTSPIAQVTCDMGDELQASIYNALVGFYRLAFASLRNVAEQMTIALQLNLADERDIFQAWIRGDCELGFRQASDKLLSCPSIADLERHLMAVTGDNLFGRKVTNERGGFVRRLYKELSDFIHGSPAFTHANIWQSNGPVFVPQAFEKWTNIFAKTYSLAILEMKLAQPNVTALAFGSSASIHTLFKQSLGMLHQQEEGFPVLMAIPDDVWHIQ
jgi:hypothetical protein